MSELKISDGKVVAFHYRLTLEDGELFDSSEGQEPLEYLHGHGNIVQGLEEELAGKKVGDSLDVKVAPSKGYGEHDPQAIQEVPRSSFPDDVEIEVGMQFGAQDEQGNVVPAWVTELATDTVTVDFNHPLAGQQLSFAVTVESIRDARPEEIEHGHPHSPDGDCH